MTTTNVSTTTQVLANYTIYANLACHNGNESDIKYQ